MAQRYPRPLDSITTLIIHCSATPNGERFTAEDIDSWHAQRGFRRSDNLIGYNAPRLLHIGYHAVIYANGPLLVCRSHAEIGAHVKGHNTNSIGVCLIGTDQFSLAQWETLAHWVRHQRTTLSNLHSVIGHNELANKICPGFSVPDWLNNNMQPLHKHLLKEY